MFSMIYPACKKILQRCEDQQMKNILILSLLFTASAAWSLALPDSAVPVLTDANLLSGFVRVDPDDRKPGTLATKAWLWQDGSDLVVHFEAEIDSSFTLGTISVKDDGSRADFLRVQLITIPDSYYAYYYAAYPLGNLVDGTRNTDMSIDLAWNSSYSYTSEYSADLWTVTMRIPLEELRFKQEQPHRWKIILTRYHYQSEETYSLPYVNTRDGKDYFLTARDIELPTPVQHKLDITFRPYFVKSYDLIEQTSSFDPENLGLDIALNPGQRTRIKLSLNPDFSDIPMDSAQDDYNSIYPPYYGENRFFFTEDLDVLGLSEELFYTRNIVQPRLAFKATGSSKALNWGALGAFDKELVVDSLLVNRDDYFQVLALNPSWRNFQMNNSLVSRVNEGYYNHVFNNMMDWEFLPKLSLSTNLSLSALKTPATADTLMGYQTAVSLSANPGDFDISLSYNRLSKDLAYEAGYLYETNYQSVGGSFGWNKSFGERSIRYLAFSAWCTGLQLNLDTNPFYTYNGGLTSNLNLAAKLSFLGHLMASREPDLSDDLHNVYNGTVGCTWYRWQPLRFYAGYTYARQLVYALSDVFPRQVLNINLILNPARSLALSFTGSWTRYGYPELNEIVANGDTLIIRLDNNYLIANAALEFTPNQAFRISLGSALSTYERAGKTAELSYYGNLRYEFRPDWFLFLGIKSAQTQTEASTWGDPLGEFRQDLNTAYAKLSVAF